jgi:hypothetical protein
VGVPRPSSPYQEGLPQDCIKQHSAHPYPLCKMKHEKARKSDSGRKSRRAEMCHSSRRSAHLPPGRSRFP